MEQTILVTSCNDCPCLRTNFFKKECSLNYKINDINTISENCPLFRKVCLILRSKDIKPICEKCGSSKMKSNNQINYMDPPMYMWECLDCGCAKYYPANPRYIK